MVIKSSKPTIVLVHGAVEDSSIWTHGVIQGLQRDGYPVKVFSNPLRGVAHDAAYLRSLLDTIEEPVILVSHAYGGAVISQAGDTPKVKALVYAGSPMPGVGESTNDCLERFPGGDFATSVDLIPFTFPDGTGGTNLLVKADKYGYLLAADVPEDKLALMDRHPTAHRLASPQRQTHIGCMDKQAKLANQASAGSRHSPGGVHVRSRSRPRYRYCAEVFARHPRHFPGRRGRCSRTGRARSRDGGGRCVWWLLTDLIDPERCGHRAASSHSILSGYRAKEKA